MTPTHLSTPPAPRRRRGNHAAGPQSIQVVAIWAVIWAILLVAAVMGLTALAGERGTSGDQLPMLTPAPSLPPR